MQVISDGHKGKKKKGGNKKGNGGKANKQASKSLHKRMQAMQAMGAAIMNGTYGAEEEEPGLSISNAKVAAPAPRKVASIERSEAAPTVVSGPRAHQIVKQPSSTMSGSSRDNSDTDSSFSDSDDEPPAVSPNPRPVYEQPVSPNPRPVSVSPNPRPVSVSPTPRPVSVSPNPRPVPTAAVAYPTVVSSNNNNNSTQQVNGLQMGQWANFGSQQQQQYSGGLQSDLLSESNVQPHMTYAAVHERTTQAAVGPPDPKSVGRAQKKPEMQKEQDRLAAEIEKQRQEGPLNGMPASAMMGERKPLKGRLAVFSRLPESDQRAAVAIKVKLNVNQVLDQLEENLVCPISFELMEDPVILVEDGHTYERAAISEWLNTHTSSPMTNESLRSKQLVPNKLVKSLIRETLMLRGNTK